MGVGGIALLLSKGQCIAEKKMRQLAPFLGRKGGKGT